MAELYILSSRIPRTKTPRDGIVLTEKDFSPFESFFARHRDLRPESFDRIHVKGVFEQCEYLRLILKHIDWLLAPAGTLEVEYLSTRFTGTNYATRPEDEVAYEIAAVFKERIRLVENKRGSVVSRKYFKTALALAAGDSIDNWSFGIVSDGRKNARILEIIDRIAGFGIPNCEIIICGPAPSGELPECVTVIDDTPFYEDIRIPLCKKKNAIARHAKYDNLAIIHDRIMFSKHWYENMKDYGNYFDYLVPEILDEETESRHVIDNARYYRTTFGRFRVPTDGRSWSETSYMDGAVIIIKRGIYLAHPLAEYLHWGEKEDVDFCRRLYAAGYILLYGYNTRVTTLTYSKKGRAHVKYPRLHRVRAYLGFLRRKLLQNRQMKKHLRS